MYDSSASPPRLAADDRISDVNDDRPGGAPGVEAIGQRRREGNDGPTDAAGEGTGRRARSQVEQSPDLVRVLDRVPWPVLDLMGFHGESVGRLSGRVT